MASNQANAKLVVRITGGVFRFVLNVFFYIVVIMCIITFSKTAYDFSYQVFGDVAVDEADDCHEYKIRIVSGESTMNVANRLYANRMIVNKMSFYLKAKLSKASIKPGTYLINSSMTYDEMFNEMSDVENSLTTAEYLEDEDKKAEEDGKDTQSSKENPEEKK